MGTRFFFIRVFHANTVVSGHTTVFCLKITTTLQTAQSIPFFYSEQYSKEIVSMNLMLVASFSINMLISKLNISKLAFVITDKGEEI